MDSAQESLNEFLAEIDPTPTDLMIQEAEEELAADQASMTGQNPPKPLPAATAWQVTDAGAADWAVRRIAAARAKAAGAKALHAQQKEQLDRWLKSVTDSAERTEIFFTAKLEDWHRPSGEKSQKLPHGSIGLRKQQPEYVKDETRLLADAKELELPIKESPDWAAIKALLVQGPETSTSGEHSAVVQSTGAVLASVRILPRPDAFYVKTGEAE